MLRISIAVVSLIVMLSALSLPAWQQGVSCGNKHVRQMQLLLIAGYR